MHQQTAFRPLAGIVTLLEHTRMHHREEGITLTHRQRTVYDSMVPRHAYRYKELAQPHPDITEASLRGSLALLKSYGLVESRPINHPGGPTRYVRL